MRKIFFGLTTVAIASAISVATFVALSPTDKLEIRAIGVSGIREATELRSFVRYSEEGEDPQAFLKRILPDLIIAAKDHGADVCVVIGRTKGGKVYGVMGSSVGLEKDCLTFLRDAEGGLVQLAPGIARDLRFIRLRLSDIKDTETRMSKALAELERIQTSYQVQVGRSKVPAQLLGEEIAPAGTSQDAFAAQLAPVLRDHAATTGHEACALFCRAPDGALAARVFTIGSHTACPIVVSCPEGYTATAENIHSHGERGEFQVNAADKVLLPRARTGQRVRRGNPEAFSDEDQEGGATYLVSPLAVQHFDGKRVRRL